MYYCSIVDPVANVRYIIDQAGRSFLYNCYTPMIVGWLSCIVGHTPIFAGYTDRSLLVIFYTPISLGYSIGFYLYVIVGCRYMPRSLLAIVG